MPALPGRPVLALARAAALMAAVSRTLPREPCFGAAGTSLLFEELALADGPAPFEDCGSRYRALAAGAEPVQLLADARGSGGGAPTPVSGLAAGYRGATQGHMAGHPRNLRPLETANRGATATLGGRAAHFGPAPEPLATGLSPRLVALRRVAMTDILNRDRSGALE